MRKIALVVAGLGFVAFTGMARAEETKTENTQKSETSTTLTGKKKVVKSKKVVDADGATTETRTETVMPKREIEKRDVDAKPVRNEMGSDEVNEKTEHHTTLTGKQQTKTTKKIEKADGSETEITKTTTEPKK